MKMKTGKPVDLSNSSSYHPSSEALEFTETYF